MSDKPSKKSLKKITICNEEIEVDLSDPQLRTHCAICKDSLTPRWQQDLGKIVHIGEYSIAGACWTCSSHYNKSVNKIKEEAREERRALRPQIRMSAKRKRAVQKRAKQLSKRPCGCGARGRHRKDCPTQKKDK